MAEGAGRSPTKRRQVEAVAAATQERHAVDDLDVQCNGQLASRQLAIVIRVVPRPRWSGSGRAVLQIEAP